MKKSLIVLAGALALSACSSYTSSTTINKTTATAQAIKTTATSTAFNQFSEQFIDNLWLNDPDWAMWSGYHKYDHILTIPNEAAYQADFAFIAKQQQLLSQIPLSSLSHHQKTDYYLISNLLKKQHWSLTQYKSRQWDPSSYNVAGGFAQIINGNYDTLDNRLRTFLKRTEFIPQYYQAAKANITTPTQQHTDLAILQSQGGLSIFSNDLLEKVTASGLTKQQKQLFKQRVKAAKQAINDYIDYLETRSAQLKANGNARDFRLGEALYEEKFAMDIQSQYSAKQIYQKAQNDLQQVTAKMTELTNQLWPKYFPGITKPNQANKATAKLIKHLSANHVKRDEFVSDIRQQIPALEAFIKAKDLLTMDPEQPLVVRETPLYMRGFAGASISAPGPYDKKENTYYNVTPLDNMTDQQAESYLSEYNHWMLQILNIHEAVPGHYAQKIYANKSPSLIKAILGNGAMVEGWAVYTERMMLEQGYGDFEPELWLMYYKWNLRVISNTLLDYGVHVNNISKDQALDLLMNQAFQEKTEAQGKWRRVTLSSVQLTSYYSGYREIYDFREEMKEKADFDLKTFHEKFLSFGSAPVKYIKDLMRQ